MDLLAKEDLQEGLLVFCPWLVSDAKADFEASSSTSSDFDGFDMLDDGSAGSLHDSISEVCSRFELRPFHRQQFCYRSEHSSETRKFLRQGKSVSLGPCRRLVLA